MFENAMSRKKFFTIVIGIFAISSMILLRNIKGVLSNCFHATDFGIYQQAIYDIAAFGNFNPYLTLRDVKIFNDHFDPVIVLSSLFVKVFGYSATNLIIFEYLWFIGFLFLVFIYLNKESYQKTVYVMLLTILTKGFLSAFMFPIHPTTWSIIPSLLFARAYFKSNTKGLVLSSIAICLFREAFPFAIFATAFLLLFEKKKKEFFLLFSISLTFLIFVFVLRPIFLGPTVPYSNMLLSKMMTNPIDGLIDLFSDNQYLVIFKLFYPFLLPFGFILTRGDTKDKKILRMGIVFTLPLLAMHFTAKNFHFQYGVLFTAPFLAILMFSRFFELASKKLKIVTLILFLASASGSWTKILKESFASKTDKCITNSEKNNQLNKLKSYLDQEAIGKTILATGGIIPRLYSPGMKYYQAGIFSKNLESYEFLLFEINHSGDTFPFAQEKIQQALKDCEINGKAIIKNEFFILIEKPESLCLGNFR